MIEPAILEKLERLPAPLQQQVLHYIDSLIEAQNSSLKQPDMSEPVAKRGGLGIWKDKIWIADDFDASLEDFREYMQE